VFTTSFTLIGRLREPADAEAWAHFVALYAPLLRAWARPHCAQEADADDVVQEVLVVVVRRLPEFAHNRRMGAFRAWLKTIAANKLGDHLRSDARRPAGSPDLILAQLADPSSGLSREWDRQHARHLAHALLQSIQGEFEPATWEAFRRVTILDEPTASVAAALGKTANAVMIARSRVLARLREELAAWEDEGDISDTPR
jgi:RNA polymerase sigma-70 factor (ECF subfamily)